MLRNENGLKIMELFFDSPTEQFHLREVGRRTGIAVTSVKNYLDGFVKEGLVVKVEKGIYPSFRANRENDFFKLHRKLNAVERLVYSGLIGFIEEKCMPNSVVLFGSVSLGEDIESSDVDLYVQSKETKLDLKSFEKKLHRKINIFFESNFSRLNKELKNNILNGIKLYGYVEVFK